MSCKKQERKRAQQAAQKAKAEAAQKVLEALPETITCEVCKQEVKYALTDAHFSPDLIGKEGGCNEDGKGLKLSEYINQFPDAPVKAPRIRELERRRLESQAIMGRLKQKAKPNRMAKAGLPPPADGRPSVEVIDKFLRAWVPEVREDLMTMGLHLQAALELLHEKGIILKPDLFAKEKALVDEARAKRLEAEKAKAAEPVQVPTPLQVVDAPAPEPVSTMPEPEALPPVPEVQIREEDLEPAPPPAPTPEPTQEVSDA